MMKSAISAVLALALFMLGCAPREVPRRTLTLRSGRSIAVLGATMMHAPVRPAALMLQYETSLPVTDREALSREADEVWESFQPEVERARVNVGIISAVTRRSEGIFTRTSGYNFAYERGHDGSWHRLPDR